MKRRTKLDIAREALRAIIAVRDYHADTGEYPQNLEPDQCFDDWAADTAETALKEMSSL